MRTASSNLSLDVRNKLVGKIETGLFVVGYTVQLRFEQRGFCRRPKIDAQHVFDKLMDSLTLASLAAECKFSGRF